MYERKKVDSKAFVGIIPEGMEVYMAPNLPTVTIKRKGVKYEITDLRLLHPSAIETVGEIISEIRDNPFADEVVFGVNCDESTVDIIIDIVMGISCKASKGGKNGWLNNFTVFSTSAQRRYDKDRKEVAFHLIQDNVKTIHNYLVSVGNPENVNYYELVMEVADTNHLMLEAYNG